MTFIIKRFQYLANKNMGFSGKRSDFKGISFRDNKDDQKGCFNCQKPGHFIANCHALHKGKAKRESIQKNKFISKFKKSIMATWDELDDAKEADKSKEETNLALVASTFSDSELEVGSDSNS